jgi:transglutaminase-like putative cysteine protease
MDMNEERSEDPNDYLSPGVYVDSDSAEILEFVGTHMSGETTRERAVSLFYAVRDGFRYDPYDVSVSPERFKASVLVGRATGYCVPKAIVLAACARAAGIPARLGFADVRNHLTTKRLTELIQTDVFYYHGYTELHLDGRWFKVTPAFNKGLCEKFGIKPLEFDGTSDCLFHEYDIRGEKHMEYVRSHGTFADVPYEAIVECYRLYCPDGLKAEWDFAEEAEPIVAN